jgi:hypothetical protein
MQVLSAMTDSAPGPASPTPSRRLKFSPRWLAVLPPLLAAIYVHRSWLGDPSQIVAGDLNFWGWLEGTQHWYWHIAHDLFRGIDPFSNNFKAFPDGNNHLMLHGNFGDAVVAAPLQWLFSFPLSYNLAVLLFTALNVVGLYRLARVFSRGWLVPSLASCLVVVHPYFVTQLEQGRLTQYLVGWAFLALAEAAALMRDVNRGGARLAFSWTLTFISFWFYGFFLTLFLAGWVLIATRHSGWAAKKRFAKALGWTVACSIPFGLPLALEALSGSGIPGVTFLSPPVPGNRWTTAAHPEDVLWFQRTEFGPIVLPITLLLTAAIALVGGWATRKDNPGRDIWALGACAAGAWILALGPFLLTRSDGVTTCSHIPLPWYLLYLGVPFFSRLSYPVMVFPFLLAGVMGLSLRAVRILAELHQSNVVRASVPVGIMLIILLELVLRVPATLSGDPYVLPEPYRWLASDESSDALLEYPFGYTDCARVHQSTHGKCLMGSEGRFDTLREWAPVDALFRRNPVLERLAAIQSGEAHSPIPRGEFEALYHEGFDYLVFRPIACGKQVAFSQQWLVTTRAFLEEQLGPPERESDGVALFRLPGEGPQNAICGTTR